MNIAIFQYHPHYLEDILKEVKKISYLVLISNKDYKKEAQEILDQKKKDAQKKSDEVENSLL